MIDRFSIFHDSFRRCSADGSFLKTFYELFTSSSDAVARKFAETDFDRQRRALGLSLHMVALAARGNDAADSYLHYIAERHSRKDLDIQPELYDLWLESLIQAVARTDPEFTSETEAAWRELMRHGIDYMISRY